MISAFGVEHDISKAMRPHWNHMDRAGANEERIRERPLKFKVSDQADMRLVRAKAQHTEAKGTTGKLTKAPTQFVDSIGDARGHMEPQRLHGHIKAKQALVNNGAKLTHFIKKRDGRIVVSKGGSIAPLLRARPSKPLINRVVGNPMKPGKLQRVRNAAGAHTMQHTTKWMGALDDKIGLNPLLQKRR